MARKIQYVQSKTSIEALRWVLFVKNIYARDWELHLKDPKSKVIKPKYVSHGGSFGELDIVKAMVERTQVDLEARSVSGMTPLHLAAANGHLLESGWTLLL